MTRTESIKLYETSGLPTVCLPVGLKNPPLKAGWPYLDASEMWAGLNPDECNVGLKCGGKLGLVAADGDSRQTVTTLRRHFDGLGIAPVEQLTATPRHRQLFCRCPDVPAWFCSSHWKPDVGKGELRAGRSCYVCAYPSTVDDRQYYFADPDINPENLVDYLPIIGWRDLAPLARNTEPNPRAALVLDSKSGLPIIEQPPVYLIRRNLPASTKRLLSLLRHATVKREEVGDFETRSHAAQSVISTLILLGRSYTQISSLFRRGEVPVYTEKGKDAEYWLRRSYNSALTELCTSPHREELARLYAHASQMPWPGQTGALDAAVYMGIISLGWAWDSQLVFAARRDLELFAEGSFHGVSNALHRLESYGHIELISRGDERIGNMFGICTIRNPTSFLFMGSTRDSMKEGMNVSSGAFPEHFTPELWSAKGLGRSCGLVFSQLTNEPLSLQQLADLTGKVRSTTFTALRRLEKEGLAKKDNHKWTRGPADISKVAKSLHCRARSEKRKARVESERERWHTYLARRAERKAKDIVILKRGGRR